MNKIFLIGNLTKDPELSQTDGGINFCKFNIAVNRKITNADGTKTVDYFKIATWRTLAENCHKYLKKGSKVNVIGTAETRRYTTEAGASAMTIEILADEVEFLTPQPKSGEGSTDGSAPKHKKATCVAELEQVEIDNDGLLPF